MLEVPTLKIGWPVNGIVEVKPDLQRGEVRRQGSVSSLVSERIFHVVVQERCGSFVPETTPVTWKGKKGTHDRQEGTLCRQMAVTVVTSQIQDQY